MLIGSLDAANKVGVTLKSVKLLFQLSAFPGCGYKILVMNFEIPHTRMLRAKYCLNISLQYETAKST